MRYKIEGEFKVKRHTSDEARYTVVLECGEAFLVDPSRFCEVTDLGDLYLTLYGGRYYYCVSKDLKHESHSYRLSPDDAISNSSHDMTDSPRPFMVRVIKSHLRDESCVDLDEFDSNYGGDCILVKHIDGNTYLYKE